MTKVKVFVYKPSRDYLCLTAQIGKEKANGSSNLTTVSTLYDEAEYGCRRINIITPAVFH